MSPWPFMTERWPERAFSIRRRMQSDGRLREIIGDYELARQALQHWRAADPPGTRRIVDYEQIVRDLEDEIEARLDPPRPPPHAPAGPDRQASIHVPPSLQSPREQTP